MSRSLEAIEEALLTSYWNNKQKCNTDVEKFAKDVVDGNFINALTSETAKNIFRIHHPDGFQSVSDAPLEILFSISKHIEKFHDIDVELLHLTAGVACLHIFVQANWTGPDIDIKAIEIFRLSSGISLDNISEHTLNQKSISELAYGGEPAYHLARAATFLRLAQILFSLPYERCQTISWWKLRVSLIHQSILDESVAISDTKFSAVYDLLSTLKSHQDLAGRLTLELGLLEHLFGHDKAASDKFIQAAGYTGLQFELTGALGKRTKFQQNDISQLVLLAESRIKCGETDSGRSDGTNSDETRDISSGMGVTSALEANVPEALPLNDDTILERTEFTSTLDNKSDSNLAHLNPASQPALHPLDQCIILSLCLNVKNTSPSHGLTSAQMAPYVDRVISHPLNWSIHTMALLLRSRLEAHRTRTVERSTLQLQALIDQMPTADSTICERLLYFHELILPTNWEMEKELAMRFLTLGVVKSALEIFERLEMWEEVVKCWKSLERPDKAISIVQDLLEGRKEEADVVLSRGKSTTEDRRQKLDSAREAKLWCLLGDLVPERALEHYKHAWLVSRETSGRAMRSLGGYYFSRAEFAEAIPCLKRAVAINPLLSRTWFILGCACVREEKWHEAREAFSRCVAIDDEDGESWNNLASVYLRMGESGIVVQIEDIDESGQTLEENPAAASSSNEPVSIPYSNKLLAFRALKQGLKFSYENWRMWTNYMIVALDVGELSEGCRAQGRIVEERSQKVGVESVDFDVINRLVDAVTRTPIDARGAVSSKSNSANSITELVQSPNEGHGLLPRVLDLFERTILPRISSTRVLRAYARLLTWQGRWDETVKAYLDGYSLSDIGRLEKGEITDVAVWHEALAEVEDIVDVLRNFGPRASDSTWQSQPRSIVRGFMARTRDEFGGDQDWARLTQLLDELRQLAI